MTTKKQKLIKRNTKSYERFLHNLQLLAFGLNRSFCQLDRDKYFDLILSDKKNKNVMRDISTKYKLERIKDDFFDATASFKLTIQDEKTRLTPLMIECVFEAHFHGKVPIDKDLAERFTTSELRIIMWPYFRQFVSDMTQRMTIPPVIVPLSAGA